GPHQAGQAPAVGELGRGERPFVGGGDRGAAPGEPHLALAAGAVPAAGRVDGDAVPARRVEHADVRRYPDVPTGGGEQQGDPGWAARLDLLHGAHGPTGSFAGSEDAAGSGDAGGSAVCSAARTACSAACRARWVAIHRAPHSSLPSSRSVARTVSTTCGVRASMIALVNPAEIAIASQVALIVGRPGIPNDTLEAPHVVLRPQRSRIALSTSRAVRPTVPSAPIGMASGSMTMSAGAMPYSSVATRTIFSTSSSRLPASIGISSASLGSATTAASYFLTSGRICSSRSSSAVTELTSARPW